MEFTDEYTSRKHYSDGYFTLELDDNRIVGLMIPREKVATCDNEYFNRQGVYYLFVESEKSCYIGESVKVKERLIRHIQDYNREKERYYWDWCIVIIDERLNKAMTEYLENESKIHAVKAGKYKILTKATVNESGLRKTDKKSLDKELKAIGMVLFDYGHDLFGLVKNQSNDEVVETNEATELTEVVEKAVPSTLQERITKLKGQGCTVYRMTARNCDAFMYEADGEYIVLEGSRVSVDFTKTFVEKKSRPYRERLELEEKGVIKDGVFTQDWKDPHISAVASVCAGHGISGREWKEI